MYMDEAGFNLTKRRRRGRNVIGHCWCSWAAWWQCHIMCCHQQSWGCPPSCQCKTGANVSGPPLLEDKRPPGNPQSCLLHMSSRTQHTGGIHKAVSCICNSNIQGCSTLGDPHPVLTVIISPSPHTENSLKNPCNVICTNK